jgi:hypothetical protein
MGMAETFYDPQSAPEPQEWLALTEAERRRLTRSFHQSARIKLRNSKLHAAIHTAVETQIATGYGPSCRAIKRLQEQGLTRHEAVHAIGGVLDRFLQELSNPPSQPDFDRRMSAAIEALTAEAWKEAGDGLRAEG